MGRRASWGILSVVAASASACTFDFDAPFADSGGGGASSSSAPGATTGSLVGSSGSGSGGAASTSTGDGGAAQSSSGVTGGEPPFGVPCGDEPCLFDPGQGACCWDEHQEHGSPRAECFTSPPSSSDCRITAQIGQRETLIRCRDASDCEAGEDCCAEFELDGEERVYSEVACADACPGSATTLCNPDAADPCPLSEADCSAAPGLPDDYFGCLF